MLKDAMALAVSFVATQMVSPLKVFAGDTKKMLVDRVGNPLRFPPVFTNGGTMTLAETNVQVWPNQTTKVNAINNSYPSPTVRIKKGETFSATFVNQLTEESTIHWHGLDVPTAMDGHPMDAVAPGNSFTYTFPIINRPGTYFYHSHAHELTGKQVYRGFAGFFIVEDENNSLGLPTGNFDIPLLIQDRRSQHVPQFTYNPNMMETMTGFLGDKPLINGTPDAYFEVSKTLYRFRILNGSNARVYKIGFSDNSPFHIIATDGGLKDEAVKATSFMLAPASRVEILMDFSQHALSQSVTLKSLPFAEGGGTQGIELNLLRFDITGTQNSGGVVPNSMPPIQYYNPIEVVKKRDFVLTMVMGGGGGMHRINGRVFGMHRIDEEINLNDLEEWHIINNDNDEFHPMHIHGLLFQILSRNGNLNLLPEDKGWKDTVLLNPSEKIKVLVKFKTYSGIYLFHCHNLEHENDGMMMNFRVKQSNNVVDKNIPTKFELHQNYPNPFNPSTTIEFTLSETSEVKLEVYDMLGKKIETLVNKELSVGTHKIKFDGSRLANGNYIYKIQTPKFSSSRVMNLIK